MVITNRRLAMTNISEKQRQRATSDRRAFLINELYRMGLDGTPCGRTFEECTLFTLEQVHINAKCRVGRLL